MLENHYPQPAVFRTVRRPGARPDLPHPASHIPHSAARRLQGRTPQPRPSAKAVRQARVARSVARHDRRACPPSPQP